MFPIKDLIRIPFPRGRYLRPDPDQRPGVSLPGFAQPAGGHQLLLRACARPAPIFDPNWALTYGLKPTDYLPFIEGTFMHGGWWHLILNMWTLFIFGASLEGRIGRLQFLSFYLVCGLSASLAHAAFNPDLGVPALGASGAIAGVLGAYATTFPRAKLTILILIVIIPLFFKVPALFYALIWFGFQFAQGFIDPADPSKGGGIAWWAISAALWPELFSYHYGVLLRIGPTMIPSRSFTLPYLRSRQGGHPAGRADRGVEQAQRGTLRQRMGDIARPFQRAAQ